MRLRCASSFVLLLLGTATLAAPSIVAAAARPKLQGATVTPMTGTTATAFKFTVQFQPAGETASTVIVAVAGISVPLAHTSGPLSNQIWTGSSSLPVGSWTATFSGTTVSGTNPDPVSVFPILVTAPTPTPVPTPTAAPTLPPTPRPTASQRPTPKPTAAPHTATPRPGSSATQASSPTPFGTTVLGASGSPSSSQNSGSSASPIASPSPSPSSAGAGPPGSRALNVPVEGVVAIGLLGAVTVAAALGERRRRRAVEAFRAQEATAGEIPPPAGDLGAGSAGNAVDDETVATIDYESPEWTDPPDR
jgi:hypothetical protein